MYYDVVQVEILDDQSVKVVFHDGKSGVVDREKLIAAGGALGRLSDPALFRQAFINRELGVLSWPGNLEIAPETLYSMATGAPLPAWMEAAVQRRVS